MNFGFECGLRTGNLKPSLVRATDPGGKAGEIIREESSGGTPVVPQLMKTKKGLNPPLDVALCVRWVGRLLQEPQPFVIIRDHLSKGVSTGLGKWTIPESACITFLGSITKHHRLGGLNNRN